MGIECTFIRSLGRIDGIRPDPVTCLIRCMVVCSWRNLLVSGNHS